MFVILPAVNRSIPSMQKMAGVVDEYNIRTGMFFYTDVEVTGAANVEMANTVRFRPHGGERPARR
jgi:hypothetical protein